METCEHKISNTSALYPLRASGLFKWKKNWSRRANLMKLKTKTSVCYVMPHIKASLSFLSLRSWQGRHIWLVFLYLFFFITRCLLHATFICWWLFYWYFYAQACWLCPPFQVKCPQVLFAQMWVGMSQKNCHGKTRTTNASITNI